MLETKALNLDNMTKILKQIQAEFDLLIKQEEGLSAQIKGIVEERLRLQGEYRLIKAEEDAKKEKNTKEKK